jgi:hypothetical protein
MTNTSENDKSEEVEVRWKNDRKEYFKKYYLTSRKGVKHYCEICNKTVAFDNRSKHNKTTKHILLERINKMENEANET